MIMKKEDITVLAQLLETIRDNVEELGRCKQKGDSEKILAIKKEIMKLQRKVEELL